MKREYKDFMREYVNEKHLDKYNHVTVLGEGFLGSTYIVIFEWDISGGME